MKCALCKKPLPSPRDACDCGQDPFTGIILHERYELLGELGRGGMGLIYRAIKLDDGQLCVIKISRWGKALQEMRQLDPAEAKKEELARIEREFTLLEKAASRSKHVVHVYDTFREDPKVGLYYPMEFLDGTPLSEVEGWNQPMNPIRVLKMMAQINEGIGVAHGLGVVHRDLNADNIFIVRFEGEDEFVKLIDFGIARNLYNRRKLFQTGDHMAFGHLDFLAPEQIGYSHETQNFDQSVAAKLDHRADIYSLGVMMFIMLTGYPPFETKTFEDLALRDWEYPPGLDQAIDDNLLVGGLRDIVTACLQPNPEQRPPDVLSLGDMLHHLLREMQYGPGPADPHADTIDIGAEFGDFDLPDDLDILGASLIDRALVSHTGQPNVTSSSADNLISLDLSPQTKPKASPPPSPPKARAAPPPPPAQARRASRPQSNPEDGFLPPPPSPEQTTTAPTGAAPAQKMTPVGSQPLDPFAFPESPTSLSGTANTNVEATPQADSGGISTTILVMLGVAGLLIALGALFFMVN